jgi:hypothetical protein
VNSSTGVISGTPTATGTSSVTVSATNTGGTGAATLTLTVNAPLGLVGWWKLDEGSGTTAADSSGNGNTGTLVNGPQWSTGQVDGGLKFDGADDRVDIPNVNHNVGASDFTWSTWAYPRRLTNLWEGLVANGDYSPALYSKVYNGQWGIYWGGDRPSGSTLTTGRWYHLTVVRQGGVVKFYQDGVQTAKTYAIATSMANGPMRLGTSAVSSAPRFGQTDLDDVRFYNRALSAVEIAALANTAPAALLLPDDAALAAPAAGSPSDIDGDGVSDENEQIDGTAPFDPNSLKKTEMTVSKIAGKMNFAAGGKDRCSVSGIIPNLPPKFDSAGAIVNVDIGGAKASFTLDAKGRGVGFGGAFALKLKSNKRNAVTKKFEFPGGNGLFKLDLRNGAWAGAWRDLGADPTQTVHNAPMTIVIDLALNGRVYSATSQVRYSGKAGTLGAFKK